MSTGALTLDQVAAAAEFATPESDAELARVAVGKPPSAIGLAARTLAPPVVADDQALYARRALSMSWTRGRRELCLSGRLPLEQGADLRAGDLGHRQSSSAPPTSRPAASSTGSSRPPTRSSRSPSSGGGERGGVRRSATTLIVHLSDDAPPFIEGAGPLSRETAERLACDARRLTIKRSGRDLVHSRVGRCASYAQLRALHKRSRPLPVPGCTATRELEAHHLVADEDGGKTELANLILLCHRHHKLLHDHHIRTSGTADAPTFSDAAGRPITTNQPHAPPR